MCQQNAAENDVVKASRALGTHQRQTGQTLARVSIQAKMTRVSVLGAGQWALWNYRCKISIVTVGFWSMRLSVKMVKGAGAVFFFF